MERNKQDRKLSSEDIAKRKQIRRRRQLQLRRRRSFLVLMLIGVVGFSIISFASNKTKPTISSHEKFLSSYNQVRVTIQKGDTSWNIQNRLTPDEDVREILFNLIKLNGRDNMGNIKPGETVIFLEPKN